MSPRSDTTIARDAKVMIEMTGAELEVAVALIAISIGVMSRDSTTKLLGVLTLSMLKDAPNTAERLSEKFMFALDPTAMARIKSETEDDRLKDMLKNAAKNDPHKS